LQGGLSHFKLFQQLCVANKEPISCFRYVLYRLSFTFSLTSMLFLRLYRIFLSQSRQAMIGGKKRFRTFISSIGQLLLHNLHLKVISLVSFISGRFSFGVSVIIYTSRNRWY
jgi:hypothetical protein